MQDCLSNDRARRLFLAAHALSEPTGGAVGGASLVGLIDRIGFVQVDSINTVERAHHMILWSRRQAYRPEVLRLQLERDRTVFEHWTHDASIIPMSFFPYWKHRFARDEHRLHQNWKRWFREGYEAQFQTILDRVTRDGPVSSSDVGEGEPRGSGGWWDWHPSKTALEWLWRTGRLSVTRRDGFKKVYDLTERVVPAEIAKEEVDHAALVDWACGAALDRLGFADHGEIARYWGAVEKSDVAGWAARETAKGRLRTVNVELADGRLRPYLIRPEVFASDDVPALPLMRILSPFDPALRDRARVERLFGFHYRIEVFVPEAQRQYGYYVFPVLEADRLIGRLDAKAFRGEGRLHLRAFWPEQGVRFGKQRTERLLREARKLAVFAGCDRVTLAEDWLRA